MPLTKKGKKMLEAFKEKYGKLKGKSIFYALERKKGDELGLLKKKKRNGKRNGTMAPAKGGPRIKNTRGSSPYTA